MTVSLTVLTLPKTRRRLSELLGPRMATVVAVPAFIVLEAVFVILRGEANDTGVPWQRREVLAADRLLGWGQTPTERLQGWLFTGHAGLIDWLAWAAYLSWFVVPAMLTVWVLFWRRDLIVSYALARFGLMYAALILFFLIPTEPPWMALDVTRIVDVLHRTRQVDTNPVAAFPSLHVGIPMIQALWLRRRGMFGASAVYGLVACLIAIAVVYTGQHYVVDCLAAVALAYAVDRVAARAEDPIGAWLAHAAPWSRAKSRPSGSGRAVSAVPQQRTHGAE
jgi:PAP2 superfamily